MITLRTLPEATLQEIFDQAAQHLLSTLQNIHDLRDPANWPQELRTLAQAYKINNDVVTKYENIPL